MYDFIFFKWIDKLFIMVVDNFTQIGDTFGSLQDPRPRPPEEGEAMQSKSLSKVPVQENWDPARVGNLKVPPWGEESIPGTESGIE